MRRKHASRRVARKLGGRDRRGGACPRVCDIPPCLQHRRTTTSPPRSPHRTRVARGAQREGRMVEPGNAARTSSTKDRPARAPHDSKPTRICAGSFWRSPSIADTDLPAAPSGRQRAMKRIGRISAVLLAGLTYRALLRARILNWGASAAETRAQLPGDELLPDANDVATR